MQEIGKRVMHEPAVAIGLVISIALTVIAVLSNADWDVDTVLYVVGPFVAALGIRPLVKPTAKIKEEQKAKAMENLRP